MQLGRPKPAVVLPLTGFRVGNNQKEIKKITALLWS